MITHPLTPKLKKIPRPTREELGKLVRKLRDAAMNTPVLDSSKDWTALIEEADAMLDRQRVGGYYKKTDVCHERIKKLAPVIYDRMNHGEAVSIIARELGMNRTTVRNWYKKEHRRRELEARQPQIPAPL